MSSPSTTRNEVTVLIPQYLIDIALKESKKVVAPVLPYDEGSSVEQPLYIEEEPGFFGLGRLLLVGAIVGSLVVFTGLQVADSHAPATLAQASVSSGIQTMAAIELVQSIKAENRTVYWLKSKQGDTYSNKSSGVGIDQITYRPAGTSISDLNQFDVIVTTYQNQATYDATPRPLLGANGRTTTLPSGVTLTYNAISPTQAIVQLPKKAEVIVLDYPASQAVPMIINDVENLAPVI